MTAAESKGRGGQPTIQPTAQSPTFSRETPRDKTRKCLQNAGFQGYIFWRGSGLGASGNGWMDGPPYCGGGAVTIIRSGYRNPGDKLELQRFYSSRGWKTARANVILRAAGRCEFCGEPPDDGRPFDVVHLVRSTLELIRVDPVAALDMDNLAAGHRRCHSRYAAGIIPRPR